MRPRIFKAFIFGLILLLTLAVGWVDWITGYRVSLLAFYTLPVMLAVWWVGAWAGCVIALAGSVIRVLAFTWTPDAPHIGLGLQIWNGTMGFLTFLLICAGASAVRSQTEALRRQVKTLTGILPICNCCKKIRDEGGYWNEMETYLHEHSEADVAHKLCPDCARRLGAGEKRPVAALVPGPGAPAS